MDPMLLLVGVLSFVAVAGVGLVFAGVGSSSGRTAKRVQAVAQKNKGQGKGGAVRPPTADAAARRKQLQRTLQEQEKKRWAAAFDGETKLRRAGLTLELKTFWMISAGLGLVATVIALALHMQPLVALMVGFVAGAGVPLWFIGVLAKKRSAKFAMAFADAVDIIVRGLRSGLPLHDCLKVIGKESPEPLAGEFRRLVESLSMGMTLDQGLEKMHERMPAPELRFFSIVLNIQQKTGGNLGEALGNLSAVLRSRRMMREKIKALSSEAVSSAGVIGCLPPGVGGLLSVVNPHYLQPMFIDPRGHVMLAIGAGVMTVGILVMRKMINFKF